MSPVLKSIWTFKNTIILFLTPLALLPLPLVISTPEASCAYVILLMAVYWCTEAIPLAVTSLLPALLFPLLGVMQSKKVCMQYLNDTNMMFVAGLMVAVAVEHWNLHKRIALRVLLLVGVRPALLMLGFMGVTAFLSMWISNTATTAMMVPILQAMLDQLDSQETAPAPIERSEEQNPAPDSQNCPSAKCKDGKVVLACGQDVEAARCQEAAEKKHICKGMTLCVCYAASIGGMATLTGTGPNLVLKGQMNQLFPQNGDVINFASWFGFAFPNMILMLALAWLWLQFLFMGFNFKKTWGCGMVRTEKEIAAYNVIREEHRLLGPMSYGECNVLVLFGLLVVLWFTLDPGFVAGWATYMFNSDAEYVTDATAALFVAVLLFILPSKPPKLCCWPFADSDPAVQSPPTPIPPLLTWKVAQKKLPWNIVLLLGGGFALAKGSEISGLSRWMGDQLTPLHSVPPWAIVIILCVLTATFTECTSNVATATLFLPVLASMAQSTGMNPLYLMVPCTLSASLAFMLPVATPPNAIVFSYGHLKVSDMAKTGITMNIIGILCITLGINTWGKAIFHLDSFPTWANTTSL